MWKKTPPSTGPSNGSTLSPETASFGGSDETDPFGGSGDVVLPWPQCLNFDAEAMADEDNDLDGRGGQVRIPKSVYNALTYWRQRSLAAPCNGRVRKRSLSNMSLRGKDNEGKRKVLQALSATLPKDDPVLQEIPALVAALNVEPAGKREPRGTTFMFTHQGDWGLVEDWPADKMASVLDAPNGHLELDVDYDQQRVQKAVAIVKSLDSVKQLHEAMSELIARVVKAKFIERWGFTLELCAKTLLQERIVRLHAHVYFARENRFRIQHSDIQFFGTLPHQSRGILALTSAHSVRNFSGLYYVVADKVGTVAVATNCQAFTGFPVSPQWVLTLLQANKMSYEIARAELIRCTRDVCRTIGTVDKWRQEMRNASLQKAAEHAQEQLALQKCVFVEIPEVQAWIEEHKAFRFRYKFLVLTGESGLGKTEFALGLVRQGRSMELNMASTSSPDLKQYDAAVHDLILFDEMAAKDILLHKKFFQAPASLLTMGSSVTNCHAYTIRVHRQILVISTNRWDVELAMLPSVDTAWLRANSVVIKIVSPLWVAAEAT